MNIKGIIHIGGHYGQEYDLYRVLNVPVIFFEPLSNNYRILKDKVKNNDNVQTFQCALGNENKKILMNVETANNSQSSSILKPKKHLEQYPHITFDYTEEVHMFRLDDIEIEKENYNFLNIDVQGYELEVLKGSVDILKNIDYIISEVNRDEVYENCAKVEELDQFLNQFNFERNETNWMGGIWGDAFYIKNK
jgi:FkbM family methyltransferase